MLIKFLLPAECALALHLDSMMGIGIWGRAFVWRVRIRRYSDWLQFCSHDVELEPIHCFSLWLSSSTYLMLHFSYLVFFSFLSLSLLPQIKYESV